jgi:hypothetical protein
VGLRACQADVAQQALVELRQSPRAGAPAPIAPHGSDDPGADAASGLDEASHQRPGAARALFHAHDLLLQKSPRRGVLGRRRLLEGRDRVSPALRHDFQKQGIWLHLKPDHWRS